MKQLTELALKRPLLIVVMFLVLIFFGLFSYNNLNYNLLPKMDFPVITVVTSYRGASPDEIENNVTKRIEDAVSSLEGISKIHSSSMESASIVVVEFKNGIDADKSQTDAQRKISQIAPLLPDGIDAPIINKFSSDDIPVLRLSVTADADGVDLFDIVDQQIKPQLSNIKGVGQVTLIGGNERQIKVRVDKDRLEFYGLSISQVSNLIMAASMSTPAGSVKTLKDEFSIDFDSKYTSAAQLQDLIIMQTPQGSKIYLKDVASVVEGSVEPTKLNHINGLPAIGVQVQKQTDANAVEVSNLTKERIASLTEQYKQIGLEFKIASDQSTYTLKSANEVMKDLMLAILIVSIVMLFFLHSLRNAAFVLVALPASIIPTFIGMYLFGMSLNLMTLMAMSLVVGILVDDSIVILENIMRHMEMGKNRRKATVDGRYEIGWTAISITMVDLVVFLPMSMVSGMIGGVIREFSMTVVFSTFMSLIVCFTLTPLLSSRWGRLPDLSKVGWWSSMNKGFENIINKARDGYTQILKWALSHKKWVFLGTFALMVGAISLPMTGFIGGAFISQGDRGEFIVSLELDPSATLYQTNEVTQKAEKIIMKYPDVITVFSNVGVSTGSEVSSSSSGNASEITVKLTDKLERKLTDIEIGEQIKDEIAQIPGVKVTVAPISMIGGAGRAALQLILKGTDRDSVRVAANQVMDVFKNTAGVVYPKFSTKDPKPQIKVSLDREKMAAFGVRSSDVGMALGISFRGNDQAKYRYRGQEYDIMVENSESNKKSIEDVKNLIFTDDQGNKFTLGQFADIRETMGETVLERNDRLSSITVQGNVQGRSTGTVGGEISDVLEEMHFPAGVTWKFTGEVEDQGDAFKSLLQALLIGVLLVYLIMVALYENAIYPFVVMMAMPLAVVGAFLALALTMNELTIFSMIGMIMLVGLVTKNGILLVDFTNQRKSEGAGLIEAIIDGGRERFRPILMTTIAMILGMMPMALAKGSGAEVKSGMAWVLIGGLTSSLIMTLVVVPCFYYVVDSFLNIFRRKRRKKLKAKVRERQLQAQLVEQLN
ncbi:MAG: efflux RND transporter permease subunit [Brumimicrobium sp.]|nr:efflux RND transporter permease subunit [Brumimicrobium sp.]